jgi:hypothetical protein
MKTYLRRFALVVFGMLSGLDRVVFKGRFLWVEDGEQEDRKVGSRARLSRTPNLLSLFCSLCSLW